MIDKLPESASSALEESYLRIVKWIVVALMSLALVAVAVAIPYALFQYTQTPKPAAPAQSAPTKSIGASDLKNFLQEEERKRQEQERRAKELGAAAPYSVPASQTTMVLRFMNEANDLMACTDEFRRLADIPSVPKTEAQKLEDLNRLRNEIEQLSRDSTRGDRWVAEMSAFVCHLLREPELAQLRKDGKVTQVFYPAIQFHAAAWTRIANERAAFDHKEQARVDADEAAELARVGAAKVKAMAAMGVAGAAFLAFMVMALYLIFARIERNLVGIQYRMPAVSSN